MPDVETLRDLVTSIDEADGPEHLEELVDQFVSVIDDCDDETLTLWLEAEQDDIDHNLAPDAAMLRAQAVTSALAMGSNLVKRGAKKVRQMLNSWIGRLKTHMTNVKATHTAKEIYLEVTLKAVSVGLVW
jgi:hypothetical protein